jgi:hypothetical protein
MSLPSRRCEDKGILKNLRRTHRILLKSGLLRDTRLLKELEAQGHEKVQNVECFQRPMPFRSNLGPQRPMTCHRRESGREAGLPGSSQKTVPDFAILTASSKRAL